MRFFVRIIYSDSIIENFFCDSFQVQSDTLFLSAPNPDVCAEFSLSYISDIHIYLNSGNEECIFKFIHD